MWNSIPQNWLVMYLDPLLDPVGRGTSWPFIRNDFISMRFHKYYEDQQNLILEPAQKWKQAIFKNCVFYQFFKTRNFRAGSRISRSASKLRVLSIIKHAIRKIEKSHKKMRILSINLKIAYRVELKFCYGTKDDIETKWVIIFNSFETLNVPYRHRNDV